MGVLIEGRWREEELPQETGKRGEFERIDSVFRDRITGDGSSGYKAEAGRYHLYIAWNCPWAHRVLIYLALKKLQDAISVAYAIPGLRECLLRVPQVGLGLVPQLDQPAGGEVLLGVLDALLVEPTGSFEVAIEQCQVAKVHEHVRGPLVVAEPADELERRFEGGGGRLEIPLLPRQHTRPVESPGSKKRIATGA